MAYRETARIRQRKSATRARVLDSALGLIAGHGFRATSMARLARQAGVATGTLYRYFPSRRDLFAQVFRRASASEVEQVRQALSTTPGAAPARIERALRGFAQRALKAPQLAWSLIAEPVDPEVEQARLEYRRAYAGHFAKAIEAGVREGSIPAQSAELSSTAMVGAMAEALVGPLAPGRGAGQTGEHQHIVEAVLRFCLQGIGVARSDMP